MVFLIYCSRRCSVHFGVLWKLTVRLLSQEIDSVSDVGHGDGFADVGVVWLRDEDEADGALVEFFVAGHFFEEAVVGEVGGRTRGS